MNIRECDQSDFSNIYTIINSAAEKYHGTIPDTLWREPYMPEDYLKNELANGVHFFGIEEKGELIAVMGVQDKDDVVLIRHSYVLPEHQRKGCGSLLLSHHLKTSTKPVLVGCLAAMDWAIRFYEKHGFSLVSESQRDELRAAYWTYHDEHVKNSVVLADQRWWAQHQRLSA